jgi:hypothetical protein
MGIYKAVLRALDMGDGTWREGGGDILPFNYITTVSPITFIYHI